jgi:large subunit ribosomal protein L14
MAIIKGTRLVVADNSGAKEVECFCILGGTRRRRAQVGDIIRCSVKKADPNGNVKKKQVVLAVIVRTKSKIHCEDGSTLQFYENACVLVNDQKRPIGTRVFGTVSRQVRATSSEVCSMAPEVM